MSGAGSAEFNGVYRRDGSYRDSPRYKHETADIYLRQGGTANSGFGILAGRERAPGGWSYFCEESRDRKGLQVVPDGGWTCKGGQDAQKPPPTVTPVQKAGQAGPLIYKAATSNEVETLRVLLTHHPGLVDAPGPKGWKSSSPLLSACYYGQSDAVRLLLAADANPNARVEPDRKLPGEWAKLGNKSRNCSPFTGGFNEFNIGTASGSPKWDVEGCFAALDLGAEGCRQATGFGGKVEEKAAEAGSVGSKAVEAAPPAKLAGQNPLSSSATSEGNAPSAGAELS